MANNKIQLVKNSIRTIPDYPKNGILFRDITTLLKDAEAFQTTCECLMLRSMEFSSF